MRFLADVNAGRAVVQWLTSRGHDVAQTAEEDPRMADGDVLRRAVEEQRIVVTTDRDFEEMIWREGRRHNGLLRLENLPRAPRLASLEDCSVSTNGPCPKARSTSRRTRKSASGDEHELPPPHRSEPAARAGRETAAELRRVTPHVHTLPTTPCAE